MNNSTRCSSCGNNGSYLVAEYTPLPNGDKRQTGWKNYECRKCKLMLEGLYLIKVIENRLSIIEDSKVKFELEKLLECVPSRESQLLSNVREK